MSTVPRFPFTPYPRGWFQVLYSDELAPGAVLPISCFGQPLVLFRSAAGVAHVLDAHCPHLGAHLGYGGRVEGEQLECPFHHWRLDGQGRCVGIPGTDKIPPNAAIHAWAVQEINGLILVHHGPEAEPAWRIPALTEYGSQQWTPYVKRRWRIRTHAQEISENIVDGAHFRYVHRTLSLPKTQFESSGPVFRTASRMLQPTPRGPVDGLIAGEAHGLGYWAIRFTGIVDLLLISAATPVDDEHVELRLTFTVRRGETETSNDRVGNALIAEVCRQVDEDVPIWENKIYRTKPLFTEGDGSISALRNWSKQFFEPVAAR